MRNVLTTLADLAAAGVAVYGGFQYDPTVGWFILAASVGFISWKLA